MQVTEETITHFTWKFFERMADKYGGDTTVNELRVINQVYKCADSGHDCGVVALSKTLDIPSSTVSRAVFSLLTRGWLTERPSDVDRRKRLISLGPKALERREKDWQDCIDWIIESSEPHE